MSIFSSSSDDDDITEADLMSDDWWRSHGMEPVYIDPSDETSFDALSQRIVEAVEEIEKQGT